MAKSKSGSKTAIIRMKDGKDGKKETQVMDILSDTQKIKSIDLDFLEAHDKIIMKPPFGSFLWSPCESFVAYVAEHKPRKTGSFFKPIKPDPIDDEVSRDKKSDGPIPGEENVFREDWGESLDGVVHPVIVVLNVDTTEYQVVEIPGYSLSQPFFIKSSSDGDKLRIGFVSWKEEPRRLGIIYCTNRSSVIQAVTVDTSSKTQSDVTTIYGSDDTCVRSPRISADGSKVVFLEDTVDGPHHKSSKIMLYDVTSKSSKVWVDSVIKNNDMIRGIFIWDTLPENTWSSDSSYILFSTLSMNQKLIVKLDVETSQLTVIKRDAILLDFNHGLIAAAVSRINQRPVVHVAQMTKDNEQQVIWTPIEKEVPEADISYKTVDIKSRFDGHVFSSILVSPVKSELSAAPCFVMPHGGPHSCFVDSYIASCIMLAKLGYKCLLVNYRGGAGVDDDFIESLPGHVGDYDVKDVISAVDYFKDQNLIDSSKLILSGGSHGGFLVTHLSGQYSHYNWISCICRNPVTDISSKLDSTDIPDWGLYESFKSNKYDFKSVPTPDQLKVMFDMSPVAHINKVKTPTLMLLGSKDRRVPMTQGLKWHRVLKARGVDSECYVYDDKHDLYKVDVDSDVFIHIMVFVSKYI